MNFVSSRFVCPQCDEKVAIFRMITSSPMSPCKCSCGVKVVEGIHWLPSYLIALVTSVLYPVAFCAFLFYYLGNFLTLNLSLTSEGLIVVFGIVLGFFLTMILQAFLSFTSILIFGLGCKEIK